MQLKADLKEQTCKSCEFYYQHYIEHVKGHYTFVNCGHCIHPNLKTRTSEDKACVHWREKSTNT